MTANLKFDLGWEALIAIVVLIFALTLLGVIAMTRRLRNHHLRVGFFIERGDELSNGEEPWPEIEQTAELPPRKDEGWPHGEQQPPI